MTIERQIVNRVASCNAKVQANGRFTIDADDRQASNVDAGDNVRVRVTKTDVGDEIRPRDSDIFNATVMESFQVNIPKSTIEKLGLGSGDIIHYIVVPKKSFPGLQDGPIRNRMRGGEQAEATEQTQRPNRETTTATFDDKSMQKTGQITVPADVMDRMGLIQGDTVTSTITWEGNDTTITNTIGTGHRITIPKETRNELGLEPGDKPEIRLAVFD